jgi:hypothetical protein
MEIEKKYKNLKIIITVFTLIIIASFSYIYQLSNENENIANENIISASNKSEVLIELVKINNIFTKVANKNPLIQSEINFEQEKVLILMQKIEKTNESKVSLIYYNKQINGFYDKISFLLIKNEYLIAESDTINNDTIDKLSFSDKNVRKIKLLLKDYSNTIKEIEIVPNGIVFNEIPVIKPINTNSDRKENFEEKPIKPIKPIEKSDKSDKNQSNIKTQIELLKAANKDKLTKIKIENLKIEFFNKKNLVDLNEPLSVKEIDEIKINFKIPKNFVVRASLRTYYVQIFDSKNNFLGQNNTVILDDIIKLNYQFAFNTNYINQEVNISERYSCKIAKKGIYTIKIIDNFITSTQINFTIK